jgi:hypothetical protein
MPVSRAIANLRWFREPRLPRPLDRYRPRHPHPESKPRRRTRSCSRGRSTCQMRVLRVSPSRYLYEKQYSVLASPDPAIPAGLSVPRALGSLGVGGLPSRRTRAIYAWPANWNNKLHLFVWKFTRWRNAKNDNIPDKKFVTCQPASQFLGLRIERLGRPAATLLQA